MKDTVLSVKEVRDNLSEVLERVATGGETIYVSKFGRLKVKIVAVASQPQDRQKKHTAFRQVQGLWDNRPEAEDSVTFAQALRKKAQHRGRSQGKK